jgi:ketosteroid isomerase-like protein
VSAASTSAVGTFIPRETARVSDNKRTIDRYIEGFRNGDHAQVLSCLTDDVEWEVPGAFRIAGKSAFDQEIENPAFTGRPTITTSRMTEENDVVVTEGTVRTQRTSGEVLTLRFCDVFVMQERKIRQLISYLMEID